MVSEAELNELAYEFARQFARIEYALKASGFHTGDGNAEADWLTFSHALENFVIEPTTPELAEAIELILKRPPRKQIVENDQLIWTEARPTTNSRAEELFVYIRRVRNNLVHGGKFNGHWFAPERSAQLIRFALLILRAAAKAEPRVHAAYEARSSE